MKRFLSFGTFRLDTRSGELYRSGQPVPLPPQPARLLLLLVSSRGELVTREEVQKTLWPHGVSVDFEQGISKCIKQVRAVLREATDESGGYVQTISRRGYRFVGTVEEDDPEPSVTWASDRRRHVWKLGAAAGVGLVALGVLTLWRLGRPESGEIRKPRFQLSLPPGVNLPGFVEPVNMLAISRDGNKVAFVGCRDMWTCQLYLRDLGEIDSRPLPGTEGAMSPFFSPDGRRIAFGAGYQLKTIDWSHGAVRTLATESTVVRGGSWLEDGTILFAVVGHGLLRVRSDGGQVEDVTRLDPERKEVDHLYPQILPGGRAALFQIRRLSGLYPGVSRGHDVAVVDFDRGMVRVLVEGAGSPRYVDGHILFGRDGILYAARFDLRRLELSGAAAPVLEGVAMWSSAGVAEGNSGEVQYDIARDGTLLYSPRGNRLPRRALALVDREDRRVWVSASKRAYNQPFVSPDGRQIAVSVWGNDGSREAFVVDVARDAWTRVGTERDLSPMGWMPDGKKLLLYGGSPKPQLLLTALDGSDSAVPLDEGPLISASAAPDGRSLLLSRARPFGHIGLLRLPLTPEGRAEPWAPMPGEMYTASFSPDGRFVAYGSDDTGREETYVSAYSALGQALQVSTQGGDLPIWSRDGKEIFFRHRGGLWSATVRTTPRLESDPPRKLFDFDEIVTNFHCYDVSPDGRLFAVVEAEPFELRPLDVVVVPGFAEEMKSRLAGEK